jgi:hypothetical protein
MNNGKGTCFKLSNNTVLFRTGVKSFLSLRVTEPRHYLPKKN